MAELAVGPHDARALPVAQRAVLGLHKELLLVALDVLLAPDLEALLADVRVPHEVNALLLLAALPLPAGLERQERRLAVLALGAGR